MKVGNVEDLPKFPRPQATLKDSVTKDSEGRAEANHASKHGGQRSVVLRTGGGEGRRPDWNGGDDVKMWQPRSGLLVRESGAFVWRDEWILPPRARCRSSTVGRRTSLLIIMSGCHLRHFSFRASTIPSFLVLALIHGRTILLCMLALSSSPAYIYHILLEYRPVIPLKHPSRSLIKSSHFSPSTSSH